MKLIFNDRKIEFMILSSRFSPIVYFPSLHIGGECVSITNTDHNLGFMFESC